MTRICTLMSHPINLPTCVALFIHNYTHARLFTAFFLTAHFSEEDFPYEWLMLWLSRRPEWQRSREFETTTRTTGPGSSNNQSSTHYSEEDADWDQWEAALNSQSEGYGWGGVDDAEGKPKTRVSFQPTYDTTHTIYYRGHWLRVRRGRKQETGSEMISIRSVSSSIGKSSSCLSPFHFTQCSRPQ